MTGRGRPRAGWRVTSVLHSKTLMLGELSSPAQMRWKGAPAGPAPWGGCGGPAKEAVERQIANIEGSVEART